MILLGLFFACVLSLSELEASIIIQRCKSNTCKDTCIEACFYNNLRGGGLTGEAEARARYAEVFAAAMSKEKIYS